MLMSSKSALMTDDYPYQPVLAVPPLSNARGCEELLSGDESGSITDTRSSIHQIRRLVMPWPAMGHGAWRRTPTSNIAAAVVGEDFRVNKVAGNPARKK